MCGIYQILNILTGDCYIGSSINIKKRSGTHFNALRQKKHHSIILQRAYNKYKEESFKVIIIEECEPHELIQNENYYLKVLAPVYNIAKDALAPMVGRKHKKSSILKFKRIKRKSGKDSPLYGKKRPQCAVTKATIARTGLKRSEAFKSKQSKNAIKLKLHTVLLPYIEACKRKIIDNKGNMFSSLSECAIFWGISPATVCDILKGRHSKTRNGVIFTYA